jgi:hypothetical protein
MKDLGRLVCPFDWLFLDIITIVVCRKPVRTSFEFDKGTGCPRFERMLNLFPNRLTIPKLDENENVPLEGRE